MTRGILSVVSAVAVSIGFGACAFERSSDPLSPTVAGPMPGVVIAAPKTMQPPNGAKIGADKGLTFTVTAVSSSGVRPITYYIEIATDVEFKNIVFAKGGFDGGTGPQASFSLSDRLVTDASYFWRVRAEDGANNSAFSDASQFTLFTPVVYQQPAAIAPINNTTVSNLHPKFSWTNASRLGTPDAVNYRIELSDTDAFTQSASAIVPEHVSGQTGIESPQDLPVSKQLFWRVQAFDSNNTGPWSPVQVFKTPARGSGTGGCTFPRSPAEATTEEWKDCFFSLIEKRGVGPTVSNEGIWALRPELNAMGADWQNGWRGDPRPRIFLPVPNCPPATSPGVPACSYSRTVDVGDYGGAWVWLYRGQT
jgi:hypothetical protein